MQIKRNVLLNPGPATTTDTIKMAQTVPDICPREKEFVSMMKQMREDLVRIVHGNLNQVEQILKENQDIALVYTTHNETGTDILNPIKEIGFLVHKYSAVFIVDTISTYAMKPIDIEKDNIDFCMASAQKGLMVMAGLSFVIGNTKLIKKSAAYPKRSYYRNLYMQYHFFETTAQMYFTPPVQTIYAARQALDEYFREGEESKWKRHSEVFEAIHAGLDKLGFKDIIRRDLQAGLGVTVKYPDDENWGFELCIACGACIKVCPAGARNYHSEVYEQVRNDFEKMCSEYKVPEMFYVEGAE